MSQKQDGKAAVKKTAKDIKRHGQLLHGAAEKIRIMLQGLGVENSKAELSSKEGKVAVIYWGP